MVTRLISSAVGIIIALAVLFLHDTIVLPIAVALISVMILFELYRAVGCLSLRISTSIGFVYAAALPFVTLGTAAKYRGVLTATTVILCFLAYVLHHERAKFEQIAMMLVGMLLIPASMSCCLQLNALSDKCGIMYLVLGLCGAWLADSGAYFVGTFCGKHKLCPKISPKKTIEGLVGGILTNGVLFVLINLVYCKIMQNGGTDLSVNYVLSFLLGMACAGIGTVGDLSASLVKRQFGIKDYGKIMPGHGGLLDRFDSVLFVVPFMAAILSLAPLYHV